MTLQSTDIILVLAFVAAGCAVVYLLLFRKLKQMVSERQLKIADQLSSLDAAIRALETRLAKHHAMLATQDLIDSSTDQVGELEEAQADTEDSETIAPEIQAVIAAAAVAAIGSDAHVRAVKPLASPWSQQGRVLVQGSHNARAGR